MTVRVAVVGCGAIARRAHLPGWLGAGAEVVVLASRTMASARAATTECGTADATTDWRAAIAREDVDAVDVCTPNALHAEVAVAAALAGKHVLVEKPIASTLPEADAMVAAAHQAGVTLMTAHNLRFAAPFVAAREAVASGSIGDVIGFRAAFGHGGPREWSPGSDWFVDPELAGGGALVDLGIHVADVLRAVLDDDAVEVTALLRPGPQPVEESAHALVRFRRGALGSLHASWAAHPAPDHQLTLFGTTGTLHLDTATPLTLRRGNGGATEQLALPASPPDLYRAFVDSVSNGVDPPVTGADGRAALEIVSAAYRSAATGSKVTLGERSA